MSTKEALDILKQLAAQAPLASWDDRERVRAAILTLQDAVLTLSASDPLLPHS